MALKCARWKRWVPTAAGDLCLTLAWWGVGELKCVPLSSSSQKKDSMSPSGRMCFITWKPNVNKRLSDSQASPTEDLYCCICSTCHHRFLMCSALDHDFSLLLQAGGDCLQNQMDESAVGSKKLPEPQQVRSARVCAEMITHADCHSQTFTVFTAVNSGCSLNKRSKRERNFIQAYIFALKKSHQPSYISCSKIFWFVFSRMTKRGSAEKHKDGRADL